MLRRGTVVEDIARGRHRDGHHSNRSPRLHSLTSFISLGSTDSCVIASTLFMNYEGFTKGTEIHVVSYSAEFGRVYTPRRIRWLAQLLRVCVHQHVTASPWKRVVVFACRIKAILPGDNTRPRPYFTRHITHNHSSSLGRKLDRTAHGPFSAFDTLL